MSGLPPWVTTPPSDGAKMDELLAKSEREGLTSEEEEELFRAAGDGMPTTPEEEKWLEEKLRQLNAAINTPPSS